MRIDKSKTFSQTDQQKIELKIGQHPALNLLFLVLIYILEHPVILHKLITRIRFALPIQAETPSDNIKSEGI
jgi:hypothetical protein